MRFFWLHVTTEGFFVLYTRVLASQRLVLTSCCFVSSGWSTFSVVIFESDVCGARSILACVGEWTWLTLALRLMKVNSFALVSASSFSYLPCISKSARSSKKITLHVWLWLRGIDSRWSYEFVFYFLVTSLRCVLVFKVGQMRLIFLSRVELPRVLHWEYCSFKLI